MRAKEAMNSILQIKNKLEPCLRKVSNLTAAYVLGSAVDGRMRPGSDIDIAVLIDAGKEISITERLRISSELEKCIKMPIDLGILTTNNLIYAREAITTGVCIFCRDKFKRDLFAATALGLYLQLREERKEIEDAYRTR